MPALFVFPGIKSDIDKTSFPIGKNIIDSVQYSKIVFSEALKHSTINTSVLFTRNSCQCLMCCFIHHDEICVNREKQQF